MVADCPQGAAWQARAPEIASSDRARGRMSTVTISRSYRIVIPRDVRARLGLRPGQEFRVFVDGACLALVPVREPSTMRGVFEGLDTEVPRDPDRA